MLSRSSSAPPLTTGIILAVSLVVIAMTARATVSSPLLPPTSPPLWTPASTFILTPTVTPTPPPTPTPTSTPTATPTPTPTPVRVSPPFVGLAGQLAYVEGGRLLVVGQDGSATVVAEEDMAHDGPPALWSPDGRRLLYATGGADERAAYHVWDAATGQTLHLDREFPLLMAAVQGMMGVPWSPDGARLLFFSSLSSTTGETEDGPSQSEFWVLDVQARRFWRVAKGSENPSATWVSTSTLVYAAHHGAEDETLRLVDVGPPTATLTSTLDGAGAGEFALSPDHRYLAGIEGTGEPGHRLWIAPLPGHPPLALPAQPTVTVPLGHTPLWSPDGRWIAYGALALAAPGGGEEAYTVLVDTTGLTLTQVITGLLPRAWSSDGHMLAGSTCPGDDCGLAATQVLSDRVVTVAPGGQTHLWDAAWSPHGTHLAYSITGPDADPEGVVLWDRATGERRLLMAGDGTGPFTDLQWSPDGCYLYFAQRGRRDEGTPLTPAPVEAIWGVGPDWEYRWQVAPGVARDNGPLPCPTSFLPGRRVIAFYGTPLGPGLGILGRSDITTTLTQLQEQIAVYEELDPDVEHIPAFHMVTTIADAFPGGDEDYNHRVPHDVIRPWIEGIQAAGGWAIADIQPAHASLDAELDLIEPLLQEPDVHLAVDPEFLMASADEIPGSHLGRITGPQINRVQAWMEQIARATGQRKLLIIHQFEDRMVEQKEQVLDYPLVDLVWDADGFGSPSPKIGDYIQYSGEAGFDYGGFKIFYRYDAPVMTPEQVLALDPPPTLVIYQ